MSVIVNQKNTQKTGIITTEFHSTDSVQLKNSKITEGPKQYHTAHATQQVNLLRQISSKRQQEVPDVEDFEFCFCLYLPETEAKTTCVFQDHQNKIQNSLQPACAGIRKAAMIDTVRYHPALPSLTAGDHVTADQLPDNKDIMVHIQ